jgi:gliding motility-associated-like protein
MNLNEGVYSILIQDDNDCEYTINPTVPLNQVSENLYVPNVLTPNGDNKNDEWFVQGECIQDFECVILNRWGNKVFESNDIQTPWNGTNLSGGNVTEGVYFYKINFTSTDGKEDELHGFIHLTK